MRRPLTQTSLYSYVEVFNLPIARYNKATYYGCEVLVVTVTGYKKEQIYREGNNRL